MPSCIVKGCTHYTGMKANHPLLTMHVFPRELSRIKLWLQQIGQNFGDLDSFASKVFDASRTGKYRICSAHFAPGSYTSQGSRIVLKNDAIPTLFPGTFPRPPPDWKPDTTAKTDSTDTSAPKTVAQKEAGPQPNADAQKRLQEGVRRNPGARPGRTPGPPKEPLLDVNGRYSGVVRKDSKTKPNELRNNWTIPIPPDTTEENRRALWSLENLLVSLLQHLAQAPLTSRAQKHKTSRLLNQTAEIVSVLTGEEWTVVKKNSHISKFYNMIREVPIKCGDVAVFFSMDEWDYIEDHEEHYKHVMVEEPKTPIIIVDDPKTEFFPETQCEQTPSFADLDFGGPLDFLPNPSPFPPLTDKEEIEREEIEVLEMSCVSEDVIDEPPAATPQRERIDSSSGDKDVGGRLDVARSPASPPAQKEKHKEKRKDDIDETLEVTCCTDDDDDMPEPPKRKDSSPKRKDSSPKRKDSSPKRKDSSPKRKDSSPKRKDSSPKRKDSSPTRQDSSPAAAAVEESESSSSELWIAQDGTTSSTWIPQDDPRPKGRNSFKYGKHAGRIQCPVSLSGTTICSPEQPMKRAESAQDPHCNLCDLSFPNKYELDLHQITHSKKQRL